jgi:hypothetical protein
LRKSPFAVCNRLSLEVIKLSPQRLKPDLFRITYGLKAVPFKNRAFRSPLGGIHSKNAAWPVPANRQMTFKSNRMITMRMIRLMPPPP